MGDAWRKLVLSTIICLVVAFAMVLVASIFEFSLEKAIPAFQLRWIMSNAWAEFLTFVPVVQAWAILITFSLAVPMHSARLTGTSFEKFGSSLVVIVLFASAFSITYGIAHPMAVSARDAVEFDSRSARALEQSHQEAFANQNYMRALSELTQYVEIAGEDANSIQLLETYRRTANQDQSRMIAETVADTDVQAGPAGSQALTDRAIAALEGEDYSTAHYLATLARSLDPDNASASRIAAEALQRLERSLPDDEENSEAELFRAIQAAKNMLDRGAVVEAYYLFKDLNAANPRNADISRYFAEVSLAVRDLAVFADELNPVLTTEGTSSFSFVNATGPDYTEIVSIGKLVRLTTGTYAQRVELFRFSPAGQKLLHLSSDFGKLHNDSMILTISDREGPAGRTPPVVHHGSLAPEVEGLIQLSPGPDELWLLGVMSSNPAGASIPDLVRIARTADQYGLIPAPTQSELLHRLSLPFLFLMLSSLVLGFSWRYRSRYLSRPPLFTWVLLGAAPLVLVPGYLLLEYGHRLLFSALLLWSGLTTSIILLLAIEAVLVGASLTYVALSARE
jgi:hypothetical protein